MTYVAFEQKKIYLRTEEDFRTYACGTCRHKEVCREWELATFARLYKYIDEDGVYRCASYSREEGGNGCLGTSDGLWDT